MKKTNLILLIAASIAMLASCGSKPSQSIESISSSSQEKKYTFNDATFIVAPDYGSGTKVTYPNASLPDGSSPAITNLSRLNELASSVGYDSIRAGSTIQANGTFYYVNGDYVPTSDGGSLSYELSASVAFLYNKQANTFAPKRSNEDVASFFAHFADASKYQFLIGAEGALSPIASLEDNEEVEISFPTDWLVSETVGDFQYVGVYAVSQE